MLIKTCRFGTLMLVALNTGLAFSHVLEMPAKLRLGARDYATTQSIYRWWGPVGALLEPGSIVATGGLAYLVRGRQPAFRLALAGVGLLVASLAVWLAFVAPMNARMRRDWEPEAMPADWTRVRNQWESAHAARALLQVVGFGTLIASVLADASPRAGWKKLRALVGRTR